MYSATKMQATQRMLPRCRLCLRRLAQQQSPLRPISYSRTLTSETTGSATPTLADPIPPPPLDSKPREYPEKIRAIVENISHLTLLETSQLNDLLKATLNIPDAPVMAMGAMPASTAKEGTPEETPEDAQTAFTVNLTNFSPDSKIKLIKEIKAQTENMNLVQAKKFVESVPQEVKNGISKEEANKLAAALEAVGGTVEIV